MAVQGLGVGRVRWGSDDVVVVTAQKDESWNGLDDGRGPAAVEGLGVNEKNESVAFELTKTNPSAVCDIVCCTEDGD